jgi:hypothetical protein
MDPKNDKVDRQPTVEKVVTLGGTRNIGLDPFVEAEQLSPVELESEGPNVLRIINWR